MPTLQSHSSGLNSSVQDEPAFWSRATAALNVIGAHRWAFAVAGTFAMVIFFWRIRYLPSLSLTDLGLVAFAIVAFSFIMMLVFVLVLLIPALLLVEWHRLGLIFGKNSVGKANERERKLTGYSLLLLMAGALLAECLLYVSLFSPLGTEHECLFPFLMGVGVLAAFVPILCTSTPDATARRIEDAAPWRDLWSLRLVLLSAGLYLFSMPLVALVVLGTHEAAASLADWQFGLMLLLLPLLHFAFFSVWSLPTRHKLVALGAIILYVLLFAGTLFEALDRAASTFQLGLMKHQSVVVSSEGCRIAKSSRVVRACRKLSGPGEALYEIRDVQILNRLGSHAVLAHNRWTPARRTGSVPIPSAHVRSWFPTAPVKGLPRAPRSRAPTAMVDIPTQRPVPTPRASRKTPARRKTVSCVAQRSASAGQ
ncbi:hypothetical protein [Stenotrophomonas maltophilia]|uniref:hypothetical protein n=1 Tax=Stenotrophomonas maltophilia TaxID=40324 RepID=UPI0013DBC547|nr:hypothetical protein [Stenotrophomonas maltophilia]